MKYEYKQDETYFHFYDRETTFSFRYRVKQHFFFIEQFRCNDKVAYLENFLRKKPYFFTEFTDFFRTMFNYAKQVDCYAVFTPLVPKFDFEFYDFKKALGIHSLEGDQIDELNRIQPILQNHLVYVYADLRTNYVSDLVSAYWRFNYRVLKNLHSTIECFDSKIKTHTYYCDGYSGTFTFEAKEDGLYVHEETLDMHLKIEQEEEDMVARLAPFIKKMKARGKLKLLVEPMFYFAERYLTNVSYSFKEHKKKRVYELLDILLKHHSKREIEVAFWKQINFLEKVVIHYQTTTNDEIKFKVLETIVSINQRKDVIKFISLRQNDTIANKKSR